MDWIVYWKSQDENGKTKMKGSQDIFNEEAQYLTDMLDAVKRAVEDGAVWIEVEKVGA